MQMVAGCQSAMAGTGWANSYPGCMDRLSEHYSDLVGFISGRKCYSGSECYHLRLVFSLYVLLTHHISISVHP